MSVILQVETKSSEVIEKLCFMADMITPTGKFLWGNLRYQRASEYNLQTFLNMKNKTKGGTDYVSKKRLL